MATKTKAAKLPEQTKDRKLKAARYKSFRISPRIKHARPKVIHSFRLFKQSARLLWRYKKLFAGVLAIYTALLLILVKGGGTSLNIPDLKSAITDTAQGNVSQVGTSLTLFGVLLGSVGSAASDVASTYQTVLLIVISLALIWALRQAHEGVKKVQIRDAYYKGMYPLVPFILVLLVISAQLIPIAVASGLYSFVIAGGLAVTAPEKLLWLSFLFLLVVLSLYMVTSSIFALYIVTLPDMRPMQALRSARELVRHRRWTIMRKVLFLPVSLLVVATVVSVPIIMIVPQLAEFTFLVATIIGTAFVHTYLYSLYRELL